MALPVDIFEQSLGVVSEDWRRIGRKQPWIMAGKQAARLVCQGKLNRADDG
jgi:hypothetical protein